MGEYGQVTIEIDETVVPAYETQVGVDRRDACGKYGQLDLRHGVPPVKVKT